MDSSHSLLIDTRVPMSNQTKIALSSRRGSLSTARLNCRSSSFQYQSISNMIYNEEGESQLDLSYTSLSRLINSRVGTYQTRRANKVQARSSRLGAQQEHDYGKKHIRLWEGAYKFNEHFLLACNSHFWHVGALNLSTYPCRLAIGVELWWDAANISVKQSRS